MTPSATLNGVTRKGIVLAGGAGTRLHPLTVAVSKQLLPIYDKPMIYYPLSVLMLAGIRDILIITTPHDLPLFQKLLGSGEHLGLRLHYTVQHSPDGLPQAFLLAEEFLAGSPSCLVLGDNFFYGHLLPQMLRQAMRSDAGATVFACPVSTPQRYGVIELGPQDEVLSLEEKPAHPKSDLALPGLYFLDPRAPERARHLRPSGRGELEIIDLLEFYRVDGDLTAHRMGRGITWLDTGTPDSLLQAAQFVQTVQQRQGLMIACLEEIAWRQGWLEPAALANRAATLGSGTYADYLLRLTHPQRP